MAEDPVLLTIEGATAVITLNRPQVRNALDTATLRLLPRLVRRADEDEEVVAIILTGADPAFCAGLDLKELGSSGANLGSGGGEGERPGPDWRGPIPATTKPLIGAVNGPAITGGLELALACDLLIASDRARFADTHARVGLHPGWGLSVRLPRAVGTGRAREMSATGRLVDAPTALTWGLVNHVVAHDELMAFCLDLAADMASADQAMLRHLMATYAEGEDATEDEAWAIEQRQVSAWMRQRTFDPDEVAARRDAIIDRGRSQL
jgi:enoyl-CoA hydratase